MSDRNLVGKERRLNTYTDPHPDWIAYAEAESIRRMRLYLDELQARKRAEAEQRLAPAQIVLDAPAADEHLAEVVDITDGAPARVVRVHHRHLVSRTGGS